MKNDRKGRYQVLWVENDNDTLQFKPTGLRYELSIHQYRSWEKARVALDTRFDNYSAIVLDGNGVVDEGEEPNADFLYQVVRELEALFAQHEEQIPWYVLSSGTAPDFEKTLQRIAMGARTDLEPLWGRLYFRKGVDLEDLCLTIRHAATQKKENKIEHLYHEEFATLRALFPPDARQTMMDILLALHFPEENRKFDPVLYYTQLRRILEHLFRAANRAGLLPDEVLGSQDKVNLSNSSLYLSGREVYDGSSHCRCEGDPVFPPVMAQLVKSILVVANKNSHTTELDNQGRNAIEAYNKMIHSNNLLFGYTLHLCDVIAWFGRYVQNGTSSGTPPRMVKKSGYRKRSHNRGI